MIDGMRAHDEQPSGVARNETEAERLDRNWNNLLQELRVVQTGVQLLTGLLLTLPFQEGFEVLDGMMRTVYLVTVACSASSTALLVAPVAMHRMVFRRHRLNLVVTAAHRCAYAGLLLLGFAMAGVVQIIFDTVASRRTGFVAGGVALIVFVGCWIVWPFTMRSGQPMSGFSSGSSSTSSAGSSSSTVTQRRE